MVPGLCSSAPEYPGQCGWEAWLWQSEALIALLIFMPGCATCLFSARLDSAQLQPPCNCEKHPVQNLRQDCQRLEFHSQQESSVWNMGCRAEVRLRGWRVGKEPMDGREPGQAQDMGVASMAVTHIPQETHCTQRGCFLNVSATSVNSACRGPTALGACRAGKPTKFHSWINSPPGLIAVTYKVMTGL